MTSLPGTGLVGAADLVSARSAWRVIDELAEAVLLAWLGSDVVVLTRATLVTEVASESGGTRTTTETVALAPEASAPRPQVRVWPLTEQLPVDGLLET